nr:MAG TPA: hypothetical protein [Caudoviricetes sp.]
MPSLIMRKVQRLSKGYLWRKTIKSNRVEYT